MANIPPVIFIPIAFSWYQIWSPGRQGEYFNGETPTAAGLTDKRTSHCGTMIYRLRSRMEQVELNLNEENLCKTLHEPLEYRRPNTALCKFANKKLPRENINLEIPPENVILCSYMRHILAKEILCPKRI